MRSIGVSWYRGRAGDESVGINFKRTQQTYRCEVYAAHHDVADQVRANTDRALDADRDATDLLMHNAMITRERDWAASYLVGSVWAFEAHGAATGSSAFDAADRANDDLVHWNLESAEPIKDVRMLKRAIQRRTGRRPNVLTLGREVFDALVDHPDIVGRLDRGQTSGPVMATADSLAALFEVEEVLVMDAIYDAAAEGTDYSGTFIGEKNGLLSFRLRRPTLRMPSAGYTMNWTGLLGPDGMRISKFRMEQNKSDRIELETAWDHKLVGPDLGCLLSSIVQ